MMRSYQSDIIKHYILYLFFVFHVCQASCPTGWTENPHSGKCIKLYDEMKSWGQARGACKDDEADLVKIVDEKMNQFISGKENTSTCSKWPKNCHRLISKCLSNKNFKNYLELPKVLFLVDCVLNSSEFMYILLFLYHLVIFTVKL